MWTIYILVLFLFAAAYEDLRTGIVDHLYQLSVPIIIFGIAFAFYSNTPLINIKTNVTVAIIVFIVNYGMYVISNLLGRNGWGGADVVILSALTFGFGLYISIIMLISVFMSTIYTIIKSIFKKEKILKTETRFLPFVFVASLITAFLI